MVRMLPQRQLSAVISGLYLLLLTSFTTATTLRIQIPPSALLPNPNALPASTHATLTSGSSSQTISTAVLRKGAILEFSNIDTTGPHLLNLYSRDYTFAPFRIDISPGNDATSSQPIITAAYETYRGIQWSDHGINVVPPYSPNPDTPQLVTITAKVQSAKQPLEKRTGFDPLSLLKSPMILMGIVGLVMAFGMPKMLENMDPEMRAEYEEMTKKKAKKAGGRDPNAVAAADTIQNFDLAGYLAGSQTKGRGGQASDGNDIRERKRG